MGEALARDLLKPEVVTAFVSRIARDVLAIVERTDGATFMDLAAKADRNLSVAIRDNKKLRDQYDRFGDLWEHDAIRAVLEKQREHMMDAARATVILGIAAATESLLAGKLSNEELMQRARLQRAERSD